VTYAGISLVTGAAGFLGQHLVTHLVRCGVKVRAAVLPSEDARTIEQLGVEVVRADLTAPGTLPPLFADHVDRVFHLAAICNFSTPYSALRRVNVEGVERITALARTAGVRAFVHMSSTSVYGRYRGEPFVEGAPREPQDEYGRSKLHGEDIVWQRVGEGLPGIVLRPCTIYGPGCTDGAGKVFSRPTAIGAIPGKGRQRLANVRVEDVAAAAYHLSLREDAVGHAFNVVDNSQPSIEEALTLAANAFGTKPPRVHLPLAVIAAAARAQGFAARLARRIPDLEADAVRYLCADYVVSNARLQATGYRLLFPDFAESMREMGQRFREGTAGRTGTDRRTARCRS
jgi:nucleoside-diphosphate-sugar epimerase